MFVSEGEEGVEGVVELSLGGREMALLEFKFTLMSRLLSAQRRI